MFPLRSVINNHYPTSCFCRSPRCGPFHKRHTLSFDLVPSLAVPAYNSETLAPSLADLYTMATFNEQAKAIMTKFWDGAGADHAEGISRQQLRTMRSTSPKL
jgi:hypothetical protein